MRYLGLLGLVVLLMACRTHRMLHGYRQLPPVQRSMADSLLRWALDHEALYTLADTLKPISSFKGWRLPLLSVDRRQRDSARQVCESLQQVAAALSNQRVQLVYNPFERPDSIYKNIEVYAVRNSVLAQRIRQQADFYTALAITPSSGAATVLAITEHAGKYQRWRSYGYLFGYPSLAVDFFVQAGRQQDSTGQLVARDFFHVPVQAAQQGYFTYAVPKGYQPMPSDSAIYHRAQATLQRYKRLRQRYQRSSGVKAARLWARMDRLIR
jgi:hypothetical protein